MKNRKFLYTFILLLVLSGICLTGGVASFLIKRPLAPPLSINTSEISTSTASLDFPVPLPTSLSINVPTATSGPDHIITKSTQTPAVDLTASSATPIPTEISVLNNSSLAETFELCSLDSPQSILLIAVDKEESNRIHPINFIRLVNLNPSEQKISVFAVSQNYFVSGQMLDRLNIPESQLGEVFNYVIKNATGKPSDIQFVASNYLARSLFDAFGFVPSHFITFDVDSTLSVILDSDTINLPVSETRLSSTEIADYILSAQKSDENYTKSQNAILLALLEYLQENNSETIVGSFSALSGKTIITDLNPAQFSQYFCILDNIDEGIISFQTLSK